MTRTRLIWPLVLLIAATGCTAPSGIFVSSEAQALGGGLFLEPTGDGGQILVLDGEITDRTAAVFEGIASQGALPALAINQSPGGNLLAAHRIGRRIQASRMDTALAVFCGSACVDIFIAGQERAISGVAELALHPTKDRRWGYELDKPYWDGLGFGAVNDRVYALDRDKVWVMTADEALQLGLATQALTFAP